MSYRLDDIRYNWRLSQIEEEVEELHIDDSPHNTFGRPVRRDQNGASSPIYSTTENVIKKPDEYDPQKEALKKITDKYDSLERVKKFIDPKPYENEANAYGHSQLTYNSEEFPPAPDIAYAAAPGVEMRTGGVISEMQARFDQHFSASEPEMPQGAGYASPLPEQRVQMRALAPAQQQQQQFLEQEPQPEASIEQRYSLIEPEGLTEQDVLQIEMFFRSHKTNVFVCQALANLYFGDAKKSGAGDNWELYRTGVPVLVLDSGESRRKRKLNIILAEKGSGFILWKDNIDHLSKYSSVHPNFHTLYLSRDHTRLAGFSYDDVIAAADFADTLNKLTSDPDEEFLNFGKKKKKKKKEEPKQKFKTPKKTEISQPCCFVHVTNIDKSEKDHYMGLLANKPQAVMENTNVEERLKKPLQAQ